MRYIEAATEFGLTFDVELTDEAGRAVANRVQARPSPPPSETRELLEKQRVRIEHQRTLYTAREVAIAVWLQNRCGVADSGGRTSCQRMLWEKTQAVACGHRPWPVRRSPARRQTMNVVNNPRRSQLFASEPSPQELADLAALFKIGAEARQALIEGLPSQVERDSQGAFVHGVPTASNENLSEMEGAWQAILRFQEQLQRPDNRDDVEAWLEDLGPNLKMLQIEEQKFLKTLNSLTRALLRSAYARGILPALNGFAATVELRAVQGITYQTGQDVDAYVPDVVDLVPIVSMAIGVDTGRDLRFQADLGQLRMLISQLRATLKDGEALAEFAEHLRSAAEESTADTGAVSREP